MRIADRYHRQIFAAEAAGHCEVLIHHPTVSFSMMRSSRRMVGDLNYEVRMITTTNKKEENWNKQKYGIECIISVEYKVEVLINGKMTQIQNLAK